MDHLVHLKEDFVIYPIKSSTEIALGAFCSRYSPCCNFFPINYVEDEFARDLGLVEDTYSGITSSIPSYNPTLDPALVFALILVLVPTLVAINKVLKQFIKTYLELN